MKPQSTTQTGAGQSAPLLLDSYGWPQIAIQAYVTGTVNYDIQVTLDDLSSTPNWLNINDANLVGQTVSRSTGYQFLPRGIRVNINSGSGSVKLTVLQPGNGAN